MVVYLYAWLSALSTSPCYKSLSRARSVLGTVGGTSDVAGQETQTPLT